MTARYQATSAEAKFALALQNRIGIPRPQSFVIPTLTTDPDEKDPTNLWMRYDGRLRGRYLNAAGTAFVYVDYPLRSDITAPPAVPTAPATPPPAPAPKTYKTTWTATWSQTYKGDGNQRTDDKGNDYLVYGSSGDSYNGTNRSLIGFNYSSIASALAGSTIKLVELKMTNIHAYWNSGVTIYFGIHNVTSKPGSWPDSSIPRHRISWKLFGKPETKTVSISLDFAKYIRDGNGKGIAIEAPNSSQDYYGFAAGVTSGYTPPQLIITYAK